MRTATSNALAAPAGSAVDDPWQSELDACRERAIAGALVKLHGGGVVSSRDHAIWISIRPASADPLEDLAIRLDAAAYRLAKCRGAVDLAIGEALDLLFTNGHLKRLGWTRQVDFSRERLGLPPRTMYDFLGLARDVRGLPDLRSAVIRGEITARKARVIAPVIRADPGREGFLLLAAKTMTFPEIEKILEDLGEAVPKDPFEIRARRFAMTAESQGHLDRAIDLAKDVLGHGKPRWTYQEEIALEFLGAHADLIPEPRQKPRKTREPSSTPPSGIERERLLAEWKSRDTREIDLAIQFLLTAPTGPVPCVEPGTKDPSELEAMLLQLLAFRSKWDEPFGRILETISTLRLYTFFGFSSYLCYATERLGLSKRVARQRVWLEKKMKAFPELRMAIRTGCLTYSKALLVAKDATPEDVGERIREAARTTWKQTARRSQEKEDRQNLAAELRRVWGPLDPMETIESAIAVAKKLFFRETRLRITDGEALGAVAAHFEAEWADRMRRRRIRPLRKKVLARTKGICAMPTCGNPADHMHHVVYRSKNGPDAEWNCVGLCASCHRRLHRGLMKLTGRAGERLEWRIWRRRKTWEVWETIGEDDVRRAGEISPLEDLEAR